MAKKPSKPRNRAAQDATLLNVRALKRRVKELQTLVSFVLQRQDRLDKELDQMRTRKR